MKHANQPHTQPQEKGRKQVGECLSYCQVSAAFCPSKLLTDEKGGGDINMNAKPDISARCQVWPLEEWSRCRIQNQCGLMLWWGAGSGVGGGDLDPEAQMGVRWMPGPVSLQLFGWHPCPSNDDGHQGQAGNEEGPQGPIEEPASSHGQQGQ